jgi:hypothetical protein
MVRGACIKIPLTPDIWCAHDEMQHTGEDTTLFFSAMWDGLGVVARKWQANIARWSNRGGGQNANSNNRDSLESILQVSFFFD